MEQCGNCKFWQHKYSEMGVCRAHAPTLAAVRFPDMPASEWCGEWRDCSAPQHLFSIQELALAILNAPLKDIANAR